MKDFAPSELGAQVVKEAIKRAGVAAEDIDHGVFGNVLHTEARDMYVSRVMPQRRRSHASQALTVNRLCGSGMQAIASAAQMLALGDAELAIAGGAESM